jgi:hypothetical protein
VLAVSNVTTTGNQAYNGTINLGQTSNLTSSAGNLTFGAIQGQQVLNLSAGANILFDGDVGTEIARLSSLNVLKAQNLTVGTNPATGLTYTLWVANFIGNVSGTMSFGNNSLEASGNVAITDTGAVTGRIVSADNGTITVTANTLSAIVTGGTITINAGAISGATITATGTANVSATQSITGSSITAQTANVSASSGGLSGVTINAPVSTLTFDGTPQFQGQVASVEAETGQGPDEQPALPPATLSLSPASPANDRNDADRYNYANQYIRALLRQG